MKRAGDHWAGDPVSREVLSEQFSSRTTIGCVLRMVSGETHFSPFTVETTVRRSESSAVLRSGQNWRKPVTAPSPCRSLFAHPASRPDGFSAETGTQRNRSPEQQQRSARSEHFHPKLPTLCRSGSKCVSLNRLGYFNPKPNILSNPM